MVGLCMHGGCGGFEPVQCGVVFLSLSCPVWCVFVSKNSRFAFPVALGVVWGRSLHNVSTGGVKGPEESMVVLSSQEPSLSVFDRIPAVL